MPVASCMHPRGAKDLSRNALRGIVGTLAEIGPTQVCLPCACHFRKCILAELHVHVQSYWQVMLMF